MQMTEGQPLMSLSDRCYMHHDDVQNVQDTQGGADSTVSVESQQCVKALHAACAACSISGCYVLRLAEGQCRPGHQSKSASTV